MSIKGRIVVSLPMAVKASLATIYLDISIRKYLGFFFSIFGNAITK